MTDRKRTRAAALAVLSLAALCSLGARAEELLVATPVVEGSLASVDTFSVSGPGTVTVQLSDLGWPDKLSSLTFAATTPTSVVASMSGAGQLTFNVSSAGVYSAVVGAVAAPNSFLDMGWYSMNISFAPAAPLPASLWLMLSGIALLLLTLRRRQAYVLPPARTAGAWLLREGAAVV